MDDLAAGDVVELKRAHPCGSTQFVVTLVGLDIRLSCAGCGARLILSRARLQARLRAVHPYAGPLQGPSVDPLHRGES